MKKLLSALLILCAISSFALADSIDLSMYTDTELVELRSQIDLEIAKRNEKKINELYRFEVEDCVAIVDSIYVTEDPEYPLLVLHFQFINYNSLDAHRFTDAFSFSAYQNGIHIYSTDQADDKSMHAYFIKSGANVEVAIGFHIRDLSTPVEINVFGLVSKLRHNKDKNELLATILVPIPD